MRSRSLLQLALSLGVLACGESATQPKLEFADYEGPPAFPNQRAALAPSEGDRVYVTLTGDALGVLDVASEAWFGPVPIGRSPVEPDGPEAIGLSPDGRFVYVALTSPGPEEEPASGASSQAGYVQKLLADDLSIVGELRVDANPAELLVSADGERLALTHYDLLRAAKISKNAADRRANLSLLSTASIVGSDGPEPERLPTCVAPHGLAQVAGSSLLYVACRAEDALALIDETAQSVQLIPLDPASSDRASPVFEPFELSASPDGVWLAVSTVGEQSGLALLTLEDQPTFATFSELEGTPGRPLWYDERTLLTPTREPDGLVQADVDGRVLGFRDLLAEACTPRDVALSGDRSQIYVLCDVEADAGSLLLTLGLDAGGVGDVLFRQSIPSARRLGVLPR